jgi:lipopolysaccharide transport system ATP-binding protein
MDDESEAVIARYLHDVNPVNAARDLQDASVRRHGTGEARFTRVELQSLDGAPLTSLPMGQGMRMRLELQALGPVDRAFLVIHVYDDKGMRICVINSRVVDNWMLSLDGAQTATVECTIPTLNLMPGAYRCDCAVRQHHADNPMDYVENAAALEIIPADVFGTGHIPIIGTLMFVGAKWRQESPRSLVSQSK